MDGGADGPDHEAFGRVLSAVVLDAETGFADADAAGGWVEAEGFFDGGEGVVEFVEEVGGFFYEGRGAGDVGSEDGGVFLADFLEG